MKVVKCSDETYAFICGVAAERKTYLADAVDFLIFKQGQRIKELEAQKPTEKVTEKVIEKAALCPKCGKPLTNVYHMDLGTKRKGVVLLRCKAEELERTPGAAAVKR